jgi:capsular polysaccharide biosynthesis protein
MDIRQLMKAVTRWWWLGLVPVIVVLAVLGIDYQKPPVTYRITMRFATGGEPADALSDDYDRYYAWLSSEYIANGLADIATSDTFASHISDALKQNHIDISPAAIRGAIASDNTQSTAFIYITWHDPEQAVTLAEAIANELIAMGPVYYPQMAELGPVARLIDTPVAMPLPTSLRVQLMGPVIRLALAVGTGCGLILLAFVLDPTIREPADLTAKGVPYLGSVPKH